MPSTRKDYGNPLLSPGERQPNGSMSVDAYGLIQAQLTFALDSDPGNIAAAIAHYCVGVPYPDTLGYPLRSYKYQLASSKGGLTMLTVDYMGVFRDSGITDPQLTGVANTTAQPIETHPNFTEVTDETIGTGSPTQLLAGKPPTNLALGTDPIFNEVLNSNGSKSYTFVGFGVSDVLNPKAGIRQFLRPMVNVRGMIFLDPENGYRAATMVNNVGRTLKESDVTKLIAPTDAVGALAGTDCLLTSASIECIGNPDSYAGIKVTYDIMVGGELGWDQDIYGEFKESIFS
jgi:hypothetical protein